MLLSNFDVGELSGSIYREKDQYVVKGKTSGAKHLKYLAAAPSDFRLSYSGSGLPFASAEQAYFNTPNKGELDTEFSGDFTFKLKSPNAYYVFQGVTLVRPHVHIYVNDKEYDILLGLGIPNRSLKNLDDKPDRSYGR